MGTAARVLGKVGPRPSNGDSAKSRGSLDLSGLNVDGLLSPESGLMQSAASASSCDIEGLLGEPLAARIGLAPGERDPPRAGGGSGSPRPPPSSASAHASSGAATLGALSGLTGEGSKALSGSTHSAHSEWSLGDADLKGLLDAGAPDLCSVLVDSLRPLPEARAAQPGAAAGQGPGQGSGQGSGKGSGQGPPATAAAFAAYSKPP